MSWLYLAVAILFEVAGTTCLKLSDDMSRLVPSAGVVVLYMSAFWLLALAIRRIDVSVAYAIWSGAGTAAIAVIGVVAFAELMTLQRFLFLSLIVVGVVGLNLSEARP